MSADLTPDAVYDALVAGGTSPDNARKMVAKKFGTPEPADAAKKTATNQAVLSRAASRPQTAMKEFPSGQRSDDYARCFALLTAISPQTDEWHGIVVDGEPYSKARPRVTGNGSVYNSVKQRENARSLRAALRASRPEVKTRNVAIACLFYRSSPGRVDVDNLLKQVLDAATGVCWIDDYQVTAAAGIVELDRDFPRTIIALGDHSSSLRRDVERMRDCEKCGKAFRLPFISSARRYCSQKCASSVRGVPRRVPLRCPECGSTFTREHAGQQYCSNECRLTQLHKKNRKRPNPRCCECGKQLHNNARRCRPCWRKNAGRQVADAPQTETMPHTQAHSQTGKP